MVREAAQFRDEAIFALSLRPIPAVWIDCRRCSPESRSSLDYLVWDCTYCERQPTEKKMFPICSAAELFEEQIRRPASRSPVDGARFQRFQPYLLGARLQKGDALALD